MLLHPQIPKPLHGLVPRNILGAKWWNETRQAAYRSTYYHCIACGVYKGDAIIKQWLEGHELYNVDYKIGTSTYVETVPLCHACHNFIHRGRLEYLLDASKITHQRYTTIIQHGNRVLTEAGINLPTPYAGPFVAWEKWRLILFGVEYKPLFSSPQEWEEEMRRRNDGS